MFIEFFYHLRAYGLKVSISEWRTFLLALERGHAANSLTKFYYLARSICCRSELDFDAFDQCFASFFGPVTSRPELQNEIYDWLKNAKHLPTLSPEERDSIKAHDFEELQKLFAERLREQKERHDGGSKWIGTGGTSPFGHSGYNPAGIRVGGQGVNQSAVQIATQRRFKELSNDIIIDTRQIGMALRRLRQWGREGKKLELDLEATITQTGKNAGEIDLVFRPERRSAIKLLLLMDVGGSMDLHSQVCEQLFSAVHQSLHFKELRHFYFHNCPYETLYSDLDKGEGQLTNEIFKTYDPSWLLVIVGDAAMNPYELTHIGGAIYLGQQNDVPGIMWIDRIKKHFPQSVWLNPEPKDLWGRTSNQLIRKVFPQMFPMSVDGIAEAVDTMGWVNR